RRAARADPRAARRARRRRGAERRAVSPVGRDAGAKAPRARGWAHARRLAARRRARAGHRGRDLRRAAPDPARAPRAPGRLPLDKLGGGSWERVKAKTRESILAMARELLEVYAAREAHGRPAYGTADGLYRDFAARFPFEETPDQQRAIDDVLADLARDKPMDRLVCGDVGFGKTEVAMRAAFLAVLEGKQVAVLVPTTVLAQQHL